MPACPLQRSQSRELVMKIGAWAAHNAAWGMVLAGMALVVAARAWLVLPTSEQTTDGDGTATSGGEAGKGAEGEGSLWAAAGSYGYVPFHAPASDGPEERGAQAARSPEVRGSAFGEGDVLWTYDPVDLDAGGDQDEERSIIYWISSDGRCRNDKAPLVWVDCWSALRGWLDRFELSGADAESRAVKERPGVTYCVFEKAAEDRDEKRGSWAAVDQGDCALQIHAALQPTSQ